MNHYHKRPQRECVFEHDQMVLLIDYDIIGRVIDTYNDGCTVQYTYDGLEQIGWFYPKELRRIDQ